MKICVKILPGSLENKIIGWSGNILKIKIVARAERGNANKVMIKFLAEKLKLSKSSIVILSGHTSRIKLLEIKGLDEKVGKEKFVKLG